jgi:hypothetical protein
MSNRNEVRCAVCHTLLGRLTGQHTALIIEPLVPYALTFAASRFDLFCPSCGAVRRFSMERIRRIVRDQVLQSPANLSDCERAVG